MFSNEKKVSGYWAIATQKHLKEFKTTSPNIDELDNLNSAGKAGRLLGAIRGNGTIENIKKIEKMATAIGITKSELHKIILPELERASDQKIELIKEINGSITGVAEAVFNNNEVLCIAGQLFENQNPGAIEYSAIATMDETKRIPFLERELIERLVNQGFSERDVQLSLSFQEQFKLIHKLGKAKFKDPIISNEYVWGPNHQKIAMAISQIDLGKKQNLGQIIDIIQNKQGCPFESLPYIDDDLLLLAKKTGMINPTKIISSRGVVKDFAFCPNMLEPLSNNDDILDDVKLLLASIRFGENYASHSRIQDPVKFLSTLINYGDIGPHDANATDYTLLEKSGIVRVVTKTKEGYRGSRTGYCLELIRKDVAVEALKILQNPGDNLVAGGIVDSFEAINDTGSFVNAETSRLTLAKSPELVKEAEDHLSRVLRDELL